MPPGHYSIVAGALLIGWAVHGFGNWRVGRARAMVVALLAYTLWAAVLALLAPNQDRAWASLEALSKLVLAFVVGITTINSVRELRWLGIGPDHFPLVVQQYGFRQGTEAHTLWLQTGAELGFPGLSLLLLFYGLCIVRLWPFARGHQGVPSDRCRHLALTVIASLVGFMVSAQFVSLKYLEMSFYVTLLGAGVLKLAASAPGEGTRPAASSFAPSAGP